MPIAALLVIALVLFVGVGTALGHGGSGGVEVTPSRVSAGAEINIRGDDFEAHDAVALFLLTADGDLALGEATADGEGHFEVTIALPSSLAVRPYEILAVDGFGDTTSAYVTVASESGGGSEAAVVVLVAAVAAGVLLIGGYRARRRPPLGGGSRAASRG